MLGKAKNQECWGGEGTCILLLLLLLLTGLVFGQLIFVFDTAVGNMRIKKLDKPRRPFTAQRNAGLMEIFYVLISYLL